MQTGQTSPKRGKTDVEIMDGLKEVYIDSYNKWLELNASPPKRDDERPWQQSLNNSRNIKSNPNMYRRNLYGLSQENTSKRRLPKIENSSYTDLNKNLNQDVMSGEIYIYDSMVKKNTDPDQQDSKPLKQSKSQNTLK